MEKLVSIITPCFNSEKYLKETYDSILNQTYKNWEWIIVDDCSQDNSVEIIRNFNNPKIKFIINKTNIGASFSRNKALDVASGKYITFIDSDDLWEPKFLEKTISYLSSNKEQLVYCSYKRVDENLNKLLEDFNAIDNIDRKRILYNCPIPMLTSLYDSSKIGKIYFPDVKLREDHAMWIELLNKVKYAKAIKESLGIYRIREKSVSRNKLNIAVYQYKLYKTHLKFNLFISLYYTFHWALNGLKKYGKL